MVKRLLLIFLLQGCSSGGGGIIPQSEPISKAERQDMLESIEEITDYQNKKKGKKTKKKKKKPRYIARQPTITIFPGQWLCCWKMCGKGTKLHSLKKVATSRSLECHCTDGNIFEVRKIGKRRIRDIDGGVYEGYAK